VPGLIALRRWHIRDQNMHRAHVSETRLVAERRELHARRSGYALARARGGVARIYRLHGGAGRRVRMSAACVHRGGLARGTTTDACAGRGPLDAR